MNKQLTQKQNLDELMKQTLLNILSAKGIIYTYYKNNKLTKGKWKKYEILINKNKRCKKIYYQAGTMRNGIIILIKMDINMSLNN
jgi:hypothetical protein